MNDRTIVSLEPSTVSQDGELKEVVFFRLLRTPAAIPGAEVLRPFEVNVQTLPSWAAPAAVQAHGKQIFDALCKHPAIETALSNVLSTPHGQTHSLFFHLVSDDAERLHWEALCDADGNFLALDGRWSVARMADSTVERPLLQRREFVAPLKIVAFLSALGISARTEWRRLKEAVTQARDEGLAIELSVYVGEEELLTEIQTEIGQGTLSNTQVDVVRSSGDLEAAVRRVQPHILHLFCHGMSSHGMSRIELASMQDWLTGSADSSLKISIDEMLNIPALENVWLVTLNCCEGAKVAADDGAASAHRGKLHSMVRQIVARGVPAAIGMLEPIDASDAHEFCGGFYSSLFEQVRATIENTASGSETVIDWEQALRRARKNVVDRHSGDPVMHRQWTLPALYVQMERFRLIVLKEMGGGGENGADSGAGLPGMELLQRMMDKAKEVARALQALPPETPDTVRQQLLALLADVPESLRPNKFGAFV